MMRNSFHKPLVNKIILLLSLFMMSWGGTLAQTSYATYTVQPNDTLILVGLRYNIPLLALATANDLPYPYLIYPGQTLILPGVLPPTPTPMFSGLSPLPVLVPPAHLVPVAIEDNQSYTVQTQDTLYNIATRYGLTVQELIAANGLTNPDALQIGQVLQIPQLTAPTPAPLPAPFVNISFSDTVVIQGQTLVIKVDLAQVASLTGLFNGNRLFFMGSGQHKWALLAVEALTPPNHYQLALTATLPDGRTMTTYRIVTVVTGSYGTENIQLEAGRETLLDPATSAAEWQRLTALWSQVTPRPQWQGAFYYPVDMTNSTMTSVFGTRRSYNGSAIVSFHTGTDFSGDETTPIYAPAAGQVVLAEPLQVRGNVVLIDHGLGLFSGFWHQSRLLVEAGQTVEAGEIIGYLGDTGLVTGPHLHWELRLNGIAVEPLQWTRQAIP